MILVSKYAFMIVHLIFVIVKLVHDKEELYPILALLGYQLSWKVFVRLKRELSVYNYWEKWKRTFNLFKNVILFYADNIVISAESLCRWFTICLKRVL